MSQPIVYVVDDDAEVRKSIEWLIQQEGISVEVFESASSLLQISNWDNPGCLLLEMHLGEMNGVELSRRVQAIGCKLPFVIMSGQGKIQDVKDALREGAIDFIEKPIVRAHLMNAIHRALENDNVQRKDREKRAEIQERIDSLTQREKEVLDLVVAGRLTKQIAAQLGVTVKTVEVHRSNITKKMQVESVIQLVRFVMEHQVE